MSRKTTLRQFLTTGQLGLLSVGITREQVEKMLGTPNDWSKFDEIGWKVENQNRAAIWHYGVLRIYFASDRVRRLVFYPEEKTILPDSLNFMGYFPNQMTTAEAFEQYLQTEGLDAERDPRCLQKDCFLVEKTVYVMFGEESITSLAYPR